MRFDLVAPCGDCPFRTDKYFHLSRPRRREIVDMITRCDGTFSCHKTVDYSDDEPAHTRKTQHCAGATILLESIRKPNQMMRIMERLGEYDRTKLVMDSPVCKTISQFMKMGFPAK